MSYPSLYFSSNAEVSNTIDTTVRMLDGSSFLSGMFATEAWLGGSTPTLTPVVGDTLSLQGGGITLNRYGGTHILVLSPSTGKMLFRNVTAAGARVRTLHVCARGMVYGKKSLTYT